MTGRSVLQTLEEDAVADFKHYRVPMLARRFVGAYLGALGVTLAAAGWHVAGWAALWSLLAGTGLAAAEKLWPTVPWPAFLQLLRDTRAVAETAKPPAGPPAPPHG